MAAIRPGKSLGFLTLGASLHSVLVSLRASPTTFPSIKIIYSKEKPLDTPVIIELKYNGIRIRFDGVDQRLRIIEVIEWGKMKLSYKNVEIAEQGVLSFRMVYNKIFGPTYPGEFLEDQSIYVLSYPGVAFSFKIPEAAAKNLHKSDDFINYLSSSTAPQCCSMALFRGNSWSEVKDDIFAETESFEPSESAEPVIHFADIDENNGSCVLNFLAHPQGLATFNLAIANTTMQDVIMALGPPSERFFKEDSRLSIHNPLGSDEKDQAILFFNYFHLGIDICFDTSIENATVKKLILHGNIPGSVQFQKYQRCRWKLHRTDGEIEPTSELKFDAYSEHYSKNSQPMMLNRTVESLSNSVELIGEPGHVDNENLADLALTDLYGSPGLIFEVMKNNSVSSLTLY